MYTLYTDNQVLEAAEEMLKEGASTYTVAQTLGRPQTTVWWHLTHRLRKIDPFLWRIVSDLLKLNNKGGGH